MPSDNRSYTAGTFELQIDGQPTTAYLKSVDGGSVSASLVDEPIGPHNMRVKHTSVVDIEPFTIDFGLSAANDVLLWIQSSWRKNWSRRNGQITHADFNGYATHEHEFYDALIAETTFPALDGASKEAAYIKIKVQPEKVVQKRSSGGNQVYIGPKAKQKMWTCAGFRLTIDGLHGFEYTNKIESFTIRQGIKKFYTGEDRFPQIEPTKIDFPNIIGTLSERYADDLWTWYNKYVIKGQADSKAQRSGSLEFLAPDRSKVLFRINLYEVGLRSASIIKSDAKADQIKRIKFDLYVGSMDLDGSGPLGME